MVSFCGQGSLGGGGVTWFLLFWMGAEIAMGKGREGLGGFPGGRRMSEK